MHMHILLRDDEHDMARETGCKRTDTARCVKRKGKESHGKWIETIRKVGKVSDIVHVDMA